MGNMANNDTAGASNGMSDIAKKRQEIEKRKAAERLQLAADEASRKTAEEKTEVDSAAEEKRREELKRLFEESQRKVQAAAQQANKQQGQKS